MELLTLKLQKYLKKADFYKFQLEAYATIFENPGEINSIKTPLLSPVIKLAILQFDPLKIENKNGMNCNLFLIWVMWN